MIIFDTIRLTGMHFQLKMIIYDLKKSRKKIKCFFDAGPKSDARGDEKQGIYFVWPYFRWYVQTSTGFGFSGIGIILGFAR